jgi:3-oxoacyl-[acyl-carrier protein] reductase
LFFYYFYFFIDMNYSEKFTNKHVFVTGGARGIGFEIARQFCMAGAKLSLIDNNQQNLYTAAAALTAAGAITTTYLVDISVQAEVEAAVSAADSSCPIDVLINNAGIASETPFLQIQEAEWNNILQVNLTGMFFVSQAVCRLMAARKNGVVVNMASKNGLDGEFGYAHYNASKAGVIMLTKTMAIELAQFGIRVNAVCPGYIQTPMSLAIDPPAFTEEFVDRYIPLNRPGNVEEVAPMFLFLASEESSFITGQVFVVDGGQLAGQKPGNDLLKKATIANMST